MKICHLTTAHPRNDVRIFEKECQSLAMNEQYSVVLLVADGLGYEVNNKVKISDIGARKGRFNRFFVQSWRMLIYALKAKADLYHFHDPELIFSGLMLKLFMKKVIYDVHEDVPKSLLGREWLPKWILKVAAFKFKLIENLLSRSFSGIITATPAIQNRFLSYNKNTICIQNYPDQIVFSTISRNFSDRNSICYTGAISKIRGIIPLLDALSYCDKSIRLHLAGAFIDSKIEQEVKSHPNFSKVKYYGQLKRQELQVVYSQSFAGLVTFLPLPNHIEAQPNKFFEYMDAGLAIIASDFPQWKAIVEDNAIGLCINPEDPKAIAKAIDKLYNDKMSAKEMGEKGRELVFEKYNWEAEKQKLIKFYLSILSA
ncbi:MAG: glycosyltransferase family 4 protein [Bacteroidales bacterium]|nr:glycosyltransferase family 4 protein [Bacteroidales bacterium]